MSSNIFKKISHFLLLYFCCCFLADVQTTRTNVHFSVKEEAKKFFDKEICEKIVIPFVKGIKSKEEGGKNNACELLNPKGIIFTNLNKLIMEENLPTYSLFQTLQEKIPEKKACKEKLYKFRILLELYREFAKIEWIRENENNKNAIDDVFIKASKHVVNWFKELNDFEAFKSFLYKKLREKITIILTEEELKVEEEKEQRRLRKRPLVNYADDPDDHIAYKKQKNLDKGSYKQAKNSFALELDSEEALDMQKHIWYIVNIFHNDMIRNEKKNPMELLKEKDHFENFNQFLKESGSPNVDKLIRSIKENLIKDGYNIKNRLLHLFWSMLLIGRQIMSYPVMGIDCEKFDTKLKEIIEFIEKWAGQNNTPWPEKLKKLIHIQIVANQIPPFQHKFKRFLEPPKVKRTIKRGEENKAEGKKKDFTEPGGEEEAANPIATLEFYSKEAFDVQKEIGEFVETFQPQEKDEKKNPMELLFEEEHFAYFKQLLQYCRSYYNLAIFLENITNRLDGFIKKEDFNQDSKHLNMYLFSTLLVIYQKIIQKNLAEGYESWEKYRDREEYKNDQRDFIQNTIKFLENWANNEKLIWPTHLMESIEIKVIDHSNPSAEEDEP